MKTECSQRSFDFHALGTRDVAGRFDGGQITSDGGGLLLRETEQAFVVIAASVGGHSEPRGMLSTTQ